MPQKDALVAELQHEAQSTRKMLEKLPADKFGWKPHDKSMTAGRLAAHIAELPVWINRILSAPDFDFATAVLSRNTYEDTPALIKVFSDHQAAAIDALQQSSDEVLDAEFIIRRGERIVYKMPRKIMIRYLTLNHIVHHRGQFSVFLRLLDIPVPGMYGPSADEI